MKNQMIQYKRLASDRANVGRILLAVGIVTSLLSVTLLTPNHKAHASSRPMTILSVQTVTINGNKIANNERVVATLQAGDHVVIDNISGQVVFNTNTSECAICGPAPVYTVNADGLTRSSYELDDNLPCFGCDRSCVDPLPNPSQGHAGLYMRLGSRFGARTFIGRNGTNFTATANKVLQLGVNDCTGAGSAAPNSGAFSARVTITHAPPPSTNLPRVSINDETVSEGNSGTALATFNVSLSVASENTVTVNFATADDLQNGSDPNAELATANLDYQPTSGALTFNPGETVKTISVPVIGDALNEEDEELIVNLTSAGNAVITKAQGAGAIANDDSHSVLQFGAANYDADEVGNYATITVNRTGDATGTLKVDYATADGTAQQRTDYTVTAGTLEFAGGETSKSFRVLLSDDVYSESAETLNLALSNPTSGASLGALSTATLTIADNDNAAPVNPLDKSDFFVKQNHYDFLSRFPDAGGFAYWTGQIDQCGSDPACLHNKRIDVANAFFLELEYQRTGAYVFRLYRAAFGNTQPRPNPETAQLPSYAAFVADRARVVGGADLATAQLALAKAFVQRPEFLTRYPANLTGPKFVDALLANLQSNSGANLATQREALIAQYDEGGRGMVLYSVADDNTDTNPIDNHDFIDTEYNRAFVATQYYGFLRRNPDLGGFNFWLGQVNRFPVRNVEIQHAMVCSFVTAAEYQQRFSPLVTHGNGECAQ